MAFDRNRPYRARNGGKAEIVATLKDGRLIVLYDDGAYYTTVMANGRRYDGDISDRDLINLPEKRNLWVNVYSNGKDNAYPTRELADRLASNDRIACVEVEYEVPME